MEEKDIRHALGCLVAAESGNVATDIQPLEQSGSERRYYRIDAGGHTYIGTYAPDAAEGHCFVELASGFRKAGRAVPEILAVSSDRRLYIQEDLGGTSLFSVLSAPDAEENMKETLRRLVALQKTPESIWAASCMHKPLGRRQVMWDLNYFKYEFLKPRNIIFDEDSLEDDFERLARRVTSIKEDFQGFMMRDCQSRNVMMSPRGPVFIDFQGGRRGPVLYDAVSILWQARAGFDEDFRTRMLDFYMDEFCDSDADSKRDMAESLGDIVLFRTLQVLGAYGFRGLVQGKAHFLLSIPGALANLSQLVAYGWLDKYPELKRCAIALAGDVKVSAEADSKTLTVEILSFSYKKGYPENLTGNGGGFMFDCRGMHNPGRYLQYRTMTGRDKPVRDFLESRGEVRHFLSSCWALTDPAIERYSVRGFTNLQIGFGCTGGQHRSVYCAEATADHVRSLFPEVTVRLIHREHPE